jgi:hypothetical protein
LVTGPERPRPKRPVSVTRLWQATGASAVVGLGATGGAIAEDVVNGPLVSRILLAISIGAALVSGSGFGWAELHSELNRRVTSRANRIPTLAVAALVAALGFGGAAAASDEFVDPSAPAASVDDGSSSLDGSSDTGGGGSSPSALALAWTVPDRLHAQDPEATQALLAAERYPVDFTVEDARDATCTGPYDWTIARGDQKVDIPVRPVQSCHFRAEFRQEDSYSVAVASPRSGKAETKVVVQDWLVVSLGDSVASGEGNP